MNELGWRSGVTRALLFGTALVPTLVVPDFLFPYVTTRAVYFRVLVELATAILLYLVVRRRLTVDLRRDAVLWAITAWVGANALAAALGVAPIRSIFGDHERMGGVWFWLHLLAFYVLLRTFMRPRDYVRLFQIAIAVAALIAAFGLVQYWLRPFNFGVGGVEAGVTIGNPGLLAPYLLANVAVCALLAVRASSRARLVYIAIAGLLTVALVFSGNRSSTLALVLGSTIAFVAYAAWSRSLRGWRALIAVLLLASGAALPFLTRLSWLSPVASRVPALSRLSSGVDSSRVVQWRAAVDGIRARPLLGVGPENYQIVWSSYYHPEMYRFIEDSRWDRAHNAYLDAFTTAGIFGFLALIAVFLALAWSTYVAMRAATQAGESSPRTEGAPAVESIALGFFAAYAFYLFFWFFDLNSAMLWIAVAAFVSARATGKPLFEFGDPRAVRWQSRMVLALGAAVLIAVLYVHGYGTLRMANALDRTRDPSRPFDEVLSDFRSVFASPAPITQHAFLMYSAKLRALYPRFPEIRSDPARAALFDRAFILAITEFERQAAQDPLNERTLVQHARVLMLGAYYYQNPRLYESALVKLHHAVDLAPRRVVTRLVLGTAYLNAGHPDRALRTFEEAYNIYPPLGQTHSYLAGAHSALGQHHLAAQWITSAVRNGFTPDPALVGRTATALMSSGEAEDALALLRTYLAHKNGPLFLWTAPTDPAAAAADRDLVTMAVNLAGDAGMEDLATAFASAGRSRCSGLVPVQRLASAPLTKPADVLADCDQPWREQ